MRHYLWNDEDQTKTQKNHFKILFYRVSLILEEHETSFLLQVVYLMEWQEIGLI